MKEKILFVTKGGDNFEEGFTYVLDLAKTMKTGIVVLMVEKRPMSAVYDDVMTAAAFAEAGEVRAAKDILLEQERLMQASADRKFRELTHKYPEISADLHLHTHIGEVQAAIRDLLKARPDIEMILLSPSLAGNKHVFDVKKLLKTITKPVVTISRPSTAEA